jgi:hypothetical protein
MVGIKSCSSAHVMISTVHIQYNNPIGKKILARSRRRESKRMKVKRRELLGTISPSRNSKEGSEKENEGSQENHR